MMTNTISIHHVTKLMNNNRNYTNTSFKSSSSNLLLNMVEKKKSKPIFHPMILSSSSKNNQLNCEMDSHDDDSFTAEVDLSEMYAFTSRGGGGGGVIIPDYFPVAVYTSGFGSKEKVALGIESGMHRHDSSRLGYTLAMIIAYDMVAMHFNHIVSLGGQPTLFMTSRSCPEQLKRVIKMVGLLHAAKWGFSVQFLDIEMKSSESTTSIGYGSIEGPMIDGKNIEVGDVLIGLKSYGSLHSHGYSLIRRVIKQSGSCLNKKLRGENGHTLRESLMKPSRIYVKEVLDIIRETKGGVKGIACIANGGITEGISRLFRRTTGLGAVIYDDSLSHDPIFKWIKKVGKIKDDEMRRTFNMGYGMVLVVSKENVSEIVQKSDSGHIIGEVVSAGGATYISRKK